MPRMNGDRSASTSRLLQLCAGYFIAYVLTGIFVKWFTFPARRTQTCPGRPAEALFGVSVSSSKLLSPAFPIRSSCREDEERD